MSETAWLIEFTDQPRPSWWAGGGTESAGSRTTDANEAVRFLRKEDAERVIVRYFLCVGNQVIATEHEWTDFSAAWPRRVDAEIIVNGRKTEWHSTMISYDSLLAITGHRGVRTVTWSIPGENRGGSIVAFQAINVEPGMCFNVSDTSGA